MIEIKKAHIFSTGIDSSTSRVYICTELKAKNQHFLAQYMFIPSHTVIAAFTNIIKYCMF